MSTKTESIPVVLLTGFLGSGKTTLLAQGLSASEGAGTLVIVNEIGEVGLDHDLLWQGGDVPLVLENGCICCTVGDDLLTTLEELFWARLHRRLPHFERIVIETTGLADPRPIIAALRERPLIAERYRYGGTLTAVDACAGSDVARHWEALAQIAMADCVILTKTDLATSAARNAAAQLVARINPLAEIEESGGGAAGLPALFAISRPRQGLSEYGEHTRHHGHEAVTFTLPLALTSDMHEVAASLKRLSLLAPRLLRAKGIALVDGAPILVQVVGGVASPPEPYHGRPGSNAEGRLVVIAMELGAEEVRDALGPLAG